MMSSFERIRRLLKNEPVDRLPYSFWTHFPGIDLIPEQQAEVTYQFSKEFDVDFIKHMPNGLYMAEAWECKCNFNDIEQGGVAKVEKYAIQHAEDWEKLKIIEPTYGSLGRELEALDSLIKKVDGTKPIICTIFSPLTMAQKITEDIGFYLQYHPNELKKGLEIISATIIKFAKEALRRGCDGVFFANQMATRKSITLEKYREFGVPFDLAVLHAIKNDSWFNVMHLHGEEVLFDEVKEYPVQAINWHLWDSDPSIERFLKESDKVIIGGLKRAYITSGNIDSISQQIEQICSQTRQSRIIFSPDCVIRYPVVDEYIHQVKDKIIELSKKEEIISLPLAEAEKDHCLQSVGSSNYRTYETGQFQERAENNGISLFKHIP
ncbi:uroporphyrinogen decarboxylase family protein [Psychrobacillus soli]|uniref:Uroporphyrinogen decarboxylase n=1 Tax=Psychrobacillus soli TaxID=1543965 RepID=A0A544SY60_9BACI|nr:uroporphyrinogen decarboxylase family protein [Psychrobacillus soli]TQR10138.1 uroporphyrinogen decarboxylase [Psychrobacillus soli]